MSYLADVEEVSEENLEKIIELNPDLIIALSTVQNLDKIKEIAPTVTFTYGKVDYLTQHLEIGKLLNKEQEAQAWIDDFKERSTAAGEEIKAVIGEDATVSVFENFDKQLYVFGDNWGRGTEVIYQAMGLKMPEKVKEMALEPGYYALSLEVLPEFAGDYVILSKVADQDNSFQETDVFKNIPAVQNGQLFEANAEEFYFNDPISLDYQLEFFKEKFLKQLIINRGGILIGFLLYFCRKDKIMKTSIHFSYKFVIGLILLVAMFCVSMVFGAASTLLTRCMASIIYSL